MTRFVQPPFLAKFFTGNGVVWDLPCDKKNIYLTFDDGPIPELTPKILKILNDYKIKATFFCVGENIIKHQELFNQILINNHEIGNHTFNHLKGWQTPNEIYFENINKFNSLYPTKLFRPPYGKIKPSQIYKLSNDYRIILWSVLTYDFDKTLSGYDCLQLALDNIYNGAIVVFHDNIKASDRLLFALPRFIEKCLAQGYSFNLFPQQFE